MEYLKIKEPHGSAGPISRSVSQPELSKHLHRKQYIRYIEKYKTMARDLKCRVSDIMEETPTENLEFEANILEILETKLITRTKGSIIEEELKKRIRRHVDLLKSDWEFIVHLRQVSEVNAERMAEETITA